MKRNLVLCIKLKHKTVTLFVVCLTMTKKSKKRLLYVYTILSKEKKPRKFKGTRKYWSDRLIAIDLPAGALGITRTRGQRFDCLLLGYDISRASIMRRSGYDISVRNDQPERATSDETEAIFRLRLHGHEFIDMRLRLPFTRQAWNI